MNDSKLNILLIEDNFDHAELIKRSFEDYKIDNTLIHLSDGEMAVKYLAKEQLYNDLKEFILPNIILLDLRLPKIDGIEVLKIIKNNDELKQIPVIVLTSSEAEADILKAYKNYANSYLVKPLDFNKFSDLMNELGFYWLVWNKSAL